MGKIMILVVDDESLVIDILVDYFQENMDCDISSGANGLEGLQLVQNNKYNLIIVDYDMPQINGIALIKAIRGQKNLNPDAPIILLSGYLDEAKPQLEQYKDIHFLDKASFQKHILGIVKQLVDYGPSGSATN